MHANTFNDDTPVASYASQNNDEDTACCSIPAFVDNLSLTIIILLLRLQHEKAGSVMSSPAITITAGKTVKGEFPSRYTFQSAFTVTSTRK